MSMQMQLVQVQNQRREELQEGQHTAAAEREAAKLVVMASLQRQLEALSQEKATLKREMLKQLRRRLSV